MVVKYSELTKDYYTSGEVAKFTNRNIKTIQKYDRENRINFQRTSTGRRRMSKEDLIKLLEEEQLYVDDSKEVEKNKTKLNVIYTRVFSQDQKNNGDLDRQALKLIQSDLLKNNNVDLNSLEIIKEVGSGLNDNRKKFLKLLEMVENDRVENIYITYKDRLTRFGYKYIEVMCKAHDVNIYVLYEDETKLEAEDKRSYDNLQTEFISDFMNLIAYFNGKYYGMRSALSRQLKKMENESENKEN